MQIRIGVNHPKLKPEVTSTIPDTFSAPLPPVDLKLSGVHLAWNYGNSLVLESSTSSFLALKRTCLSVTKLAVSILRLLSGHRWSLESLGLPSSFGTSSRCSSMGVRRMRRTRLTDGFPWYGLNFGLPDFRDWLAVDLVSLSGSLLPEAPK